MVINMENKLLTAADTAKNLFAELGLCELTIRDGDFELTLKKTPVAAPSSAQPDPLLPSAALGTMATAFSPTESGNPSALIHCKEIKSPLVGVLYLTPAPGAAPFVSVGDHVARGDVLCIVEAMKMMNEITADTDGTILDICADQESLVEYGQVLFKIG